MSTSGSTVRERDESGGPGAFDEQLSVLEQRRASEVTARLEQARRLEREATVAGDERAAQRARLIAGDMLHRTGDVSGGARLAVSVQTWATAQSDRHLLARSHLVLSSMFEGIGDPASTLEHAVRAIDLVDESVPARDRGNYLLRLADALAYSESAHQARRRYREAEAVLTEVGDRERLLNVLNNRAVLESELGDTSSTLAAVERLEAAIGDDEMNADYADTIARCRLVAGDLGGAERAARLGLHLLDLDGSTKAIAPAELSLTLAEVLMVDGRHGEAQGALDRCIDISRERGLAGMTALALGVQAQLFAAGGSFERAYDTHREFHAATMKVRSHQQAAAARAREALFETAEARREAEQFRRQARIDPLTDLYNRRFVDETLPQWLDARLDDDADPIVIAIVDIDHFKRINDERSHAVGDEVLRHLAGLLAAPYGSIDAPPPLPGFAARIGGEEFLVAERWCDVGDAIERVERLRCDVSGYDWTALSSALHVTISAGVAVARPGDTQQELLQRADQNLYAAKSRGRDRVVA